MCCFYWKQHFRLGFRLSAAVHELDGEREALTVDSDFGGGLDRLLGDIGPDLVL
jgi:hypothetical protein